MREESTFDWIVFRTVTRIVGHADFHADGVAELLKVILHDVLIRGVASTAVKQQQDGSCIGITLSPDPVPVPHQTVARELTGIVRQADVEVPSIAMQIEDAVRNQDAISPAWKVVIERTKCSAASRSSVAKQTTDELFGLCIHGKTRVASTFVLFPELCDSAELRVTIR